MNVVPDLGNRFEPESPMRPFLRNALFATAAFGALVYANNTSLLAARDAGRPVLLAHRGIAQRYAPEGLDRETCTASRIFTPTHGYLENTVPSLRASFAAGADINELDIHPTTDGRFAVFHDWTLDCRTNGSGVTREHSLAELKALDIGHGYTADGGRTFPLRGKGIGLMPSLDEVLAAFPDRRFLINVKSRDLAEGAQLAALLARLPEERRALLMVYGDGAVMDVVKARSPTTRVMSERDLRRCLIRYIAYGWTGWVPEACRDTLVLVPINVAPWLWGWPNRLLNRFERAGSQVYVLGPFYGRRHGGTAGLDLPEDIERLPEGYSGGIWTNEIEAVARRVGVQP